LPAGFSTVHHLKEIANMLGWMAVFGLLAVGGATEVQFEAGKLTAALFGMLFFAAWLTKTAGRRAW
jgi:hypothetical protein